jgi:hypothetical protein
MCLLLFILPALFVSVSSSSPPALRAQVAFPQVTPAFPVFDGLHPRQDSSTCVSSGNTRCPDGNGCCPSDTACTSTISGGNAYPLCAAACNGGPTCTTPITACCPRGLICAPDGLCNTPTGTNTVVEVSIIPSTAIISFQQTTPTAGPLASISSVFGDASSSIDVSVSAEESSLGTSQTGLTISDSAPSARTLEVASTESSQTRGLGLGGGSRTATGSGQASTPGQRDGSSTATGSGQASDPNRGDGSKSDFGRELVVFGSLLVSLLLIL